MIAVLFSCVSAVYEGGWNIHGEVGVWWNDVELVLLGLSSLQREIEGERRP